LASYEICKLIVEGWINIRTSATAVDIVVKLLPGSGLELSIGIEAGSLFVAVCADIYGTFFEEENVKF